MPRRLLVTSALPYANGDIHIGHLLEYIQTDIWVRFMRMAGHEVWFVCADDAHGTPVMLRARAEGVAPEELIGRMRKAHERDFADFDISFDNYYSTHSPENRELSSQIYERLRAAGLIAEREVEQMYDPSERMFLPDRYVKGICPRCAAADQHGDSCEACGAAYSPTELKNPVSVISGVRPERRVSLHYFFRLGQKADFLRDWIAEQSPGPGPGPRLQPSARNKLGEWLGGELRDWDISRDPPYFGFAIPGTKNKFFYVWLDAPIGYMASFRNLCATTPGIEFDDFFKADSDAELYHFIGKDILYFHGLFWPAMLEAAGFRTPTRLFAHGFLSVNGAKMSKSRGTFITARSYVTLGLNTEWLRYYFASKLGDRIEDVDLNLEDFLYRTNADLVGKLANIPSRVAGFLARRFDGRLGSPGKPWISPDFDRIAGLYERRRFADAMREIMTAAEQVNRRLEEAKPWQLDKSESGAPELHAVCTAALQAFRVLVGLLKPVLPATAAQAEEYLRSAVASWAELTEPLPAGHQVGKYKHLLRRVENDQLAKLVAANKDGDGTVPQRTKAPAGDAQDGDRIGIEDFAKVDLRIAEVVAAEEVEGSDKLLKLKVSLGGMGERQVFAGLRGHVNPASLVGRRLVMCANLEHRKMRFGVSEGMVLAAENGGKLSLLIPEGDAGPGAKIS